MTRLRFSKIPIISRKRKDAVELLLRWQHHWRPPCWYWPSITEDDRMPSFLEFIDRLCAELNVDPEWRRQPPWLAKQVWVHPCYQEIVYGGTGELACYAAEVMDVSEIAEAVPELLTSAGREYQWITHQEARDGCTAEGQPIAPAVWTIFEHVHRPEAERP